MPMKERKSKVQGEFKNLSKRERAKILGVNISNCYVERKTKKQEMVTIMNEIREK